MIEQFVEKPRYTLALLQLARDCSSMGVCASSVRSHMRQMSTLAHVSELPSGLHQAMCLASSSATHRDAGGAHVFGVAVEHPLGGRLRGESYRRVGAGGGRREVALT